MLEIEQNEFDHTIGQLDHVLSKLVLWGKRVKKDGYRYVTEPNAQTLKHHAEDMIAAGQKIISDLGIEVQGTPQPRARYAGKFSETKAENRDLEKECKILESSENEDESWLTPYCTCTKSFTVPALPVQPNPTCPFHGTKK